MRKKRTFNLFLICLLFFSTISLATGLKLRIISEKAVLRLQPSADSEVVSTLPMGGILESEGKVGNWYYIKIPKTKQQSSVSGFVNAAMVDVIGEVGEVIEVTKEEKIPPLIVQEPEFEMKTPKKTIKRGITAKGLKIGLNFTNFYGENVAVFEDPFDEYVESKMGFCIGAFITYNILDMFAIQPEILYTTKGAKSEEELWGRTLKGSINLSYLEIPVLAKFLIPSQSNIKPSFYAGPSLAIKLSGKKRGEYNGDVKKEDLQNVKGTDLGLVIGAGLDLNLGFLGQGKVTVDIRYTFGLTSISEIRRHDEKNKAISLMIGYKF